MEDQSSCTTMVPPGFRFHPTEEELVGYYLARKVASLKIDIDIIQEVDLYRIEPWDLQERCGGKHGGGQPPEEQTEWYFFSYKDRKYPSGTRTNRATAAGFWKATGRDKPVLSSSSSPVGGVIIGMRKTLVFYRGRAPNGRKTDWIIHEYRLQSNEHAPTQEEGWVVCRAFVKPVPNQQHYGGYPPAAMMMMSSSSSNSYNSNIYYHDNPNAQLTMTTTTPAATSDDHNLGLAAYESKQQVHIFPDMLQSPTLDVDCDDGGYVVSQTTGGSIDQQLAAAGTIDWNLWSSLLPPSTSSAQLFQGEQQPAAPCSSSFSEEKKKKEEDV